MIALLVEKKKLRWDSTIGQVLPDLKEKIHADYLGVTVAQLLAHEAGVVPNVIWLAAPRDKSTREQRLALVPIILKDAPADKPGTKLRYSNASFVVAAAMAETAADASWEDLMTKTLFKPLGMTSKPASARREPRASRISRGATTSSRTISNRRKRQPLVLGPAGTVHVSAPSGLGEVPAALHLQGAHRGRGSSSRRSRSPNCTMRRAKAFKYAGGWVVGKDGDLTHGGSNGYWFAHIRILPKKLTLRALDRGRSTWGATRGKAVDEAEKVLSRILPGPVLRSSDRFGGGRRYVSPSFRLHYSLSRRQRLAVELVPWLPAIAGTIGFGTGAAFLVVNVSPWFFPFLLLPVTVYRGLFAFLFDIVVRGGPPSGTVRR